MGPDAAPDRSAGLRAVTFNIRSGLAQDGRNAWPLRRGRVRDVIRDLDPDVVGLQEAFWFQLRWLLDELDGYDHVGVGRHDGRRKGEHGPILFRRDRFTLVDTTTKWLSDEPDRPGSRFPGARFKRIVTTATLEDAATGRTLDVVNTHLDHKDPELRTRGMGVVCEQVRPEPTILLGDLNADVDEPLFGVAADAGLRPAVPPDAGPTFHRFRGGDGTERIDHVLVTDHWRVERSSVDRRDGRPASDHWPVVADLVLE